MPLMEVMHHFCCIVVIRRSQSVWPTLEVRGLHKGANARGRGLLEVAYHDFLVITQAGLSLHIKRGIISLFHWGPR